jgi:hypothetical protein
MRSSTPKKKWLCLAALVLITAAACWVVIPAAYGDQPRMYKALDHLRAAKADLERASPNKGGHRVKAIVLINQAIHEVEAGIAYGRSH